MIVAYIGVPIAQGADKKGVEESPDFFRRSGVINMFQNITGCFDLGNVHSSIIAEEKFKANSDVKFLNTVIDMTTQLRDKVSSVIKQGYFPLIVGGDHSLSIGSGAGVALATDNVGVIWFDAHGDFNTEETSPSGNIHGMPCAALMGECTSSLNNVVTKHIPHQNFFWIGTRDLDEGELQMIEKKDLQVYSSKLVREKGINVVIEDIIQKMELRNINKIHLSIEFTNPHVKINKIRLLHP